MQRSDRDPFLPGYAPVERHHCPRCGRVARIRYEALPGPQAELEPPYRLGIDDRIARVAGYPGGAIAVGIEHAHLSNDWYQHATHCGYMLAAGTPEPESFVNAIYKRLVRFDEPTERITAFDFDRFTASPFSLLAASDAGGPPLRLLAAPVLLRALLSTGVVPVDLRAAFEVGEAPAAELRSRFLATIGAVTRPLA